MRNMPQHLNLPAKGVESLPPHPYRVHPQQQQQLYTDRLNKTLQGWMSYAPMLLARSRGNNPMVRSARSILTSPVGTPQYMRSVQRLSSYDPNRIREYIINSGYGEAFAPENRGYWTQMVASNSNLLPWRAYGSAQYMRRRPEVARGAHVGGLPSYEWKRYSQSVSNAMRDLYAASQDASRGLQEPQYRSSLQHVLEYLRGKSPEEITEIVKQIIGSIFQNYK